MIGSIENTEDLKSVEKTMDDYNFKLAYYSSAKELNIDKMESLEIKLVDKKTTYVKNINSSLLSHPLISSYESVIPSPKLLDLAIQSGIYSRFNVDKRIGKEKFEEMYALWMINSLNRKFAKDVLVFNENNDLAGFVTLGEKNNRADIGIIAVDHIFRGKGIGKKLMTSAEKWSYDNGYKEIQIVTQGNNIPACKLYESLGYSVEKVEYFYHIWKKYRPTN